MREDEVNLIMVERFLKGMNLKHKNNTKTWWSHVGEDMDDVICYDARSDLRWVRDDVAKGSDGEACVKTAKSALFSTSVELPPSLRRDYERIMVWGIIFKT